MAISSDVMTKFIIIHSSLFGDESGVHLIIDLHEHWSIGADAQSVSDTFDVTTPIFFMQIGLYIER